jgi:hypothetical protein
MQGGEMMQSQINPENMAGILLYDSDEIIKKIKVKSSSQQTTIIKAISKYNNKINEIKAFNFETFTKVKTFLDKERNETMLNRDNLAMKEAKIEADEMLFPIREKVQEQQTIINTVFEKELSPKQYSTWLKYQEKKQNGLKSKTPENTQMQGNGQQPRGTGQKQGMGRGGF